MVGQIKRGMWSLKFIVIDHDDTALQQIAAAVDKIPDMNAVKLFSNSSAALEYVKQTRVEAVILDVCMLDVRECTLVSELRKTTPGMVIVFVSEHEEDAVLAWKERVDYFIRKPYKEEDLSALFDRMRLLTKRQNSRVRVRTFGRFDLFIDGKVILFTNSKAKELLALCIDHRGGMVTMEEAVDKLWENRAFDSRVKNLYRKAVMYLKQLFQDYNVNDFFFSVRGACGINREVIDCDLYDLLTGKPEAIREWHIAEKYLEEYSWAEGMSVNIRAYVGRYCQP